MMIRKKIALAIMVAGMISQASALELGEINGTKFSVGGYIKAEGVFTDPDDGDTSFEGSARQTRINFAADRQVDGHKLRAFVEGDFWDNNTSADSTYAWRLRHAYLQVDGLTVGQTWNGQFFANAPFDVETINFFGLGAGTIAGSGAVIRPDLVVHYTHGGFRLTLQDPIYSDANIPDMVAAYTYRTDNGHAFNVALTGREVETLNNDSEFGAAISVAGKFKFGNSALALSAYTGEGNNIYSGWGYAGTSSPANQPFSEGEINANGDLVKTTGFSAGVSHRFSDKLRGNIRYGQVTADEVAANVADDTFKMTNVNLIYTYLPGLEFGIEWRDQNAANRPPSSAGSSLRPAGQQLELMAMYKF
ncbi:porin [Marinobacterium iners]|nr:porin [Marinobacterium iners]